ncbi:hypothetical protein, partial [Herbidospora mongoliensis]|uniref:hypothetical protein n=1 Tax=Herbidospora mongoliensis TaxID=688067 RepID=UPI001C3F286A
AATTAAAAVGAHHLGRLTLDGALETARCDGCDRLRALRVGQVPAGCAGWTADARGLAGARTRARTGTCAGADTWTNAGTCAGTDAGAGASRAWARTGTGARGRWDGAHGGGVLEGGLLAAARRARPRGGRLRCEVLWGGGLSPAAGRLLLRGLRCLRGSRFGGRATAPPRSGRRFGTLRGPARLPLAIAAVTHASSIKVRGE